MYSSTGAIRLTDDEKDTIVKDYLPQIKVWAARAKSTLPDSVDIDELYSAAALGLIECLDKYDKSRNVSFHTYVEHRVKGAILDALRNLDFLSRNARGKIKALEGAAGELAKELGRTPTIEELAAHTGIEEDELYRIYDLQGSDRVISLDESSDEDGVGLIEFIQSNRLSPEEEVMQNSVTEILAEEIDKLKEKERLVISLYYYEELTMKEIGEVLDLTESRVSQLHASAVQKMKRKLKDVL
ncbi:MAG: FliA/WhiG family RNA polymerase sigma factor [Deferribacteraceae bacterium]|jgi:RNA polymerase sigma factor for flagellar operon FliA|nr:FliA/WhiG family RNA polymerase sigma factor [Deferribacteraceae bacterium]